MSGSESFRDSRATGGQDGLSGAAGPAARTSDATVGGGGGGGGGREEAQTNAHQNVFSLVLALRAHQQRCEHLLQHGQGAPEEEAGAVVVATTGMPYKDFEGAGGDDDDPAIDGGFSSKGVAAAAATGASVCDNWEGEADALVQELREARCIYPSEVEFYLTQLCIIVALGEFTRPALLVEFLLELCGSDLRIAHKTHWFLKSFCAGSGSKHLPLEGLTSFALRVQHRGCAVASRLSRALGQSLLAPLNACVVGQTAPDVSSTSDGGPDKSPAGEGISSPVEPPTSSAGEPSANILPGGRGTRGVEAEEALAAGEAYAGRVCQEDKSQSEEMQGPGARESVGLALEEEEDDSLAEHYDPAMFFVEALLGLADQLGALASKKRAKGLQDGLERINEFFLSEQAQGSDVIYVPFGGGFHQIRAIHPQESMHFSTKERVPLLVCLEVQEVRVPTTLTRATRAARVKSPATDASGGASGNIASMAAAAGGEGDSVVAGATLSVEDNERVTEHAGEGGLMERFWGTVHSFVKLQSEEEDNELDSDGDDDDDDDDPVLGSGTSLRSSAHAEGVQREEERAASPLIHLEDSIEADVCSSRTVSDAGFNLGLSASGASVGSNSESQRYPATANPTSTISPEIFQELSGGVRDRVVDVSLSSPEEGSGVNMVGVDYGDDDMGGASSQGGFWYGEGGGASALEAAMGQWGGDLESTAAPAVGGGGTVGDVGVPTLLQEEASGNFLSTGKRAGVVDGEDDSWEIVDAPSQWEADPSKTSLATGVGEASGTGSAPDSQSDSYSEYLAATEAERLDRQLAAEAEEEEAKVDAEALAREGSGAKRAGRYYFAPPPVGGGSAAAAVVTDADVGGDGGVVKKGRRKRLGAGAGGHQQQQQQQQQPRIIFKEQWREKELRVWQEEAAADVFYRGGSGFKARSSREGGSASAGGWRERGSSPPKGWKLLPIIVKANDDLRQEQFVGHLVAVFDQIFKAAKLGARLRPYEIMATSPTAGVIEAVPDTVSLDALKRHTPHLSLHEFFRRHFGRRGMLRQARANFVESCAAYSVVCYLLQIKDRHNGNLLLSADGHLVHIDWGFALELSPGGNLGFESAPFKLTQEFVEVMGGARSTSFQKYRSLCVRTFLEARRSREKIMNLVEMMVDFRPDLACFGSRPDAVLKHLRRRFQPDKSAEKCVTFVHELIEQSMDNWRTRLFDTYQRTFVGIQ